MECEQDRSEFVYFGGCRGREFYAIFEELDTLGSTEDAIQWVWKEPSSRASPVFESIIAEGRVIYFPIPYFIFYYYLYFYSYHCYYDLTTTPYIDY